MRESEMQSYLYENPQVLFPGMRIESREREYSVLGKRIDLFFVVDGLKHIVEVKAVPITREHVGQLVEYYGLMRQSLPGEEFRLTLVAPHIPAWRVTYLEELGIRCVELPEIPSSYQGVESLEKTVRRASRAWSQRDEVEREVAEGDRFLPADICAEITPRKIGLIHRVVRASLPRLSREFPEYEIQPLRIQKAVSNHFFREHHEPSGYGSPAFVAPGWWWAFTLGFQERMPPNDVPQLAVSANDFGLDLCVNAELLPAQAVLLEKARARPAELTGLLRANQHLRLKTYLRFEQQPRAYHWILMDYVDPGAFDANTILAAYRERSRGYVQLREKWIGRGYFSTTAK